MPESNYAFNRINNTQLKHIQLKENNVTCIPIARQRVDKHKPSTIEGHPLLGNGPVNTHS
jgi:hypothetical protein